MDKEYFKELCSQQYLHRMAILNDEKKSRSYSSNDRLIQFKRLAVLHGKTPEEICMILCSKHFLDLLEISSNPFHPLYNNLEYIRELISDLQNYMDLLNGIVTERLENETMGQVLP